MDLLPVLSYREAAMTALLVRQGNLPNELTSFVGRRNELATAKRLLGESRVVTLTGAGGVGKTRLAFRLAGQLKRVFADGVWLVDLATLFDASLVAPRMAAALGLRDDSNRWTALALAEHLADRQLLLLVDNCEHLLSSCAVVAQTLLQGSSELRILATSRQALGIAGEQVVALSPLSVPLEAERPSSPNALLQYEAVALFVERARSSLASFNLTAHNMTAVSSLVQRLDGIPLALELAAARVRVLSPEQILARLDDGQRLLTAALPGAPPHQRSLQALIDWSFDLCTQDERLLWARLSVFPRDFDLDAVEAICSGEGLAPESVLEAVAGLVDKSVLIADGDDVRVRYRLPETLRDYGRHWLEQWGQQAVFRRRHFDYYRSMCVRAWKEWFGPRQVQWVQRLRVDHVNMQAAFDYGQAEIGATSAGREVVFALSVHWSVAGSLEEGRHVLERAAAIESQPSRGRAFIKCLAAWVAVNQADPVAAEAAAEESRRLARQFEDIFSYGLASLTLGRTSMSRGDDDGARALFQEALATGLSPLISVGALRGLVEVAARAGDLDEARARMGECITICEAHGELWEQATTLWDWAVLAWAANDDAQATKTARDSLRLWAAFPNRLGVAQCVEVLAWIAARERAFERSAMLLGAADSMWQAAGASLFKDLAEYRRDARTITRRSLGEERFDALTTDGRNMSLGDVLGYALDEHVKSVEGVSREPAVLTRREGEIADLVAQGLSNREIAIRLVIARRTAEGHVEHILTKLGFTSRSQIAAWVAGQGASSQ